MSIGPDFPPSGDALRENLFRLFQRSYRAAKAPERALVVYRSSARLLGALCAEPWAQRSVYPAESALVLRFLQESAIAPPEPQAVLRKSLTLGALAATWRILLQGLERGAFASLCDVSGAQHLQAALARGKGVMLVHSHTLFAPYFWCWLESQGIAPGVTVGHWAWQRGRAPGKRKENPARWVLEVAKELHAASAGLRAGGLAHVFGDGRQGARGIELAFCNRRRPFRPTFAELAAAAGAPALTTAVALGADGRISITIDQPLAADTVEDRMREYAGRLGKRWHQDPAQIPWTDMAGHLRFPAA